MDRPASIPVEDNSEKDGPAHELRPTFIECNLDANRESTIFKQIRPTAITRMFTLNLTTPRNKIPQHWL